MSSRLLGVLFVTYFVGRVLPALVLLAVLWQFHQTIQLLASGEQIPAYVAALGHVSRARGFAFLLGVLGVAYGLYQRSARRQLEATVANRLKSTAPA